MVVAQRLVFLIRILLDNGLLSIQLQKLLMIVIGHTRMDYYIQLEVSPDVSALTETVILAGEGNSAATCTAPGSNMLTFFRDRDELVRTLGFLNTEYGLARTSTTDIYVPSRQLGPRRRTRMRLTGHRFPVRRVSMQLILIL